jgi:hypothetical protein
VSDRPELTAPWEARVLAIAETLRRQGALDWDDFARRVVEQVGTDGTPTYADWLAVLEDRAATPPGQ